MAFSQSTTRVILITFAGSLLVNNLYHSTAGSLRREKGLTDVTPTPELTKEEYSFLPPVVEKSWLSLTKSENLKTVLSNNESSSSSTSSTKPVSSMSTPTKPTEQNDETGQSHTTRPKKTTKESTSKQKKPLNVVVLYPDDMRHDSLSVAGNPVVETPFLDKLAGEGMRFTHNCVTTSICWPFYKKWNETFPALLWKAGYYTGHIGKWQFSDYDFVRVRYNMTVLAEGMHWMTDKKTRKRTHITDHNRNSAIKFLRNRPQDTPFFLGVAFYAPKALGSGDQQYNPKPETLKRYMNKTVPQPPDTFNNTPFFFRNKRFEARNRYRQRFGTPELYQRMMKEYYSMITEVDSACEDIYKELERQGELDNTLIIFTTDNGYFHAEHGLAGKWFPYQESIRVPLIIRDPRMPESKRGETDDSFTLNIDLAETILGAANVKPPRGMQGRDIADLYLRDGKKNWRSEFLYDFGGHIGKSFIPKSLALVQKEMKLMKFPQWKEVALFNLTNDPLEETDLSRDERYKVLLKSLLKKFDRLKRDVKFG